MDPHNDGDDRRNVPSTMHEVENDDCSDDCTPLQSVDSAEALSRSACKFGLLSARRFCPTNIALEANRQNTDPDPKRKTTGPQQNRYPSGERATCGDSSDDPHNPENKHNGAADHHSLE